LFLFCNQQAFQNSTFFSKKFHKPCSRYAFGVLKKLLKMLITICKRFININYVTRFTRPSPDFRAKNVSPFVGFQEQKLQKNLHSFHQRNLL